LKKVQSFSDTVQYVDRIHKNLKLTITQENNNQISFLDLLITRQSHKLSIDIYRKSTKTDTTISYTSNHPIEHKLPAYRSYINRMNLPLGKENLKKEWQTILATAHNSFPANKIIKLRKQLERRRNRQETITNPEKKDKWTTFTYYSPQIRKITNLFKHTDIRIALKCSNNLQRLTNAEKKNKTQEHKCRGIYALTCKTCNHKYIGQTSRDLNKRFQEHVRYIKNSNPQSAFAKHILHNRHEYGTTEEIMKLVKPIKDPRLLIPYE